MLLMPLMLAPKEDPKRPAILPSPTFETVVRGSLLVRIGKTSVSSLGALKEDQHRVGDHDADAVQNGSFCFRRYDDRCSKLVTTACVNESLASKRPIKKIIASAFASAAADKFSSGPRSCESHPSRIKCGVMYRAR